MITKPPAINVVFFPESANYGLAGTNRLQNIIYYLRKEGVASISNIALADRSKLFDKGDEPPFIGHYQEIYYAPSLRRFFTHIFKTAHCLRKFRRKGARNVLYFYGEIDLKNFFFVIWAKKLGYRVVIDIVEDLDAHTKFRSFKNKMKYKSAVFFRKRLDLFASGFTAVSSHLADKFRGKFPQMPLFFLPVTVNTEMLAAKNQTGHEKLLTLFYSGSFNEKDGLPYLLEGMHLAAGTGIVCRLILSGRGTAKEMETFWAAVDRNNLRGQVDYKGFLSRRAYLETLSSEADVFCMTRINSAYANAGFPFKLGEFLATGKPVIASRVGDVEKYLSPEDAYLVTPERPDEIKNALVDIAGDPGRARATGFNGKQVALKHFDHETYAAPLKNFLADEIWKKH